jgi:hypothetical protein
MIKLKQILTEGMGDCYQAAGRLIMEYIGKGKLVHGMVNGQGSLEGIRFGHAWVEVGSKVLDHSNSKKKSIPKKLYYAMGRINPRECKYYKYKDAAKFMVGKGHWGPWEMSGGVVMAEEIPDAKGEIGKKNQRIPNDILDKLDEAKRSRLAHGSSGRTYGSKTVLKLNKVRKGQKVVYTGEENPDKKFEGEEGVILKQAPGQGGRYVIVLMNGKKYQMHKNDLGILK